MVKIDLLDKKIITLLDRDARVSASALARKLSVAKETVHFRIKRLIENKIIKGFYPVLDTSLIQASFYKIFIKFSEMHPTRKNKILGFLATYPQMSQVLLLEGKYDVQLFLLVREQSALMTFMAALNTFCGKEIQHKEILLVDSMYRFNLKFLHDDGVEQIRIVRSTKITYSFDDTSWKTLCLFSKNARISVTDIAKKLKISSQLALYHLKKLYRDKVIISTHVAINYDALDLQHYHLTFQVNDHAALSPIIQFFNSKKRSMFASQMIGLYDGSVEVLVQNNEELRLLLDALLSQFSDKINTLDVLLIYKEYELDLYPLDKL